MSMSRSHSEAELPRDRIREAAFITLRKEGVDVIPPMKTIDEEITVYRRKNLSSLIMDTASSHDEESEIEKNEEA